MKDFMLIGVGSFSAFPNKEIEMKNNVYLGTVKSNVKAQINYFSGYECFILETWSKGKLIEQEYYNKEMGWHK